MIKIMRISNMEKFIARVEACQGDVLLNLPDGSECSLKTDNTARQMLKLLHSDNEELDIRLTDPRDYGPILSFMMSAAA